MDLKTFHSEVVLEKLRKISQEFILPVKFVVKVLSIVLDLVTGLLGRALGSVLLKGHFHLLLSGTLLFGPLLCLWVSRYSIFANTNHFLYRKFLRSAWGWTFILTGSFMVALSLSSRRSLNLCLRHLSRLMVSGLLWWLFKHLLTLLEDATGTCYEPVSPEEGDAPGSSVQLLLHEDQTKASCTRARMQWRGYEVSQDVFILCLCSLLILEEISIFKEQVSPPNLQQKPPGSALSIIFLLCALLLGLWMFLLLCLLAYFPKFPAQQLGGALGYLTWRGLYQGWFRLQGRWFCPGMPGDGLRTMDNDRM